MKKSERLFYLLELLKQKGGLKLEEISKKCDISDRTTYRNLRSLIELGFPIQFDKGYKLKQISSQSIFNSFTASEIDIIRFALNTHQLGNLFPFKQLSQRLINGDAGQNRPGENNIGESVPMSKEAENSQKSPESDKTISKFIQAIEEKRLVRIKVEGSSKNSAYIPLAIKIRSTQLHLIVSSKDVSSSDEIPLCKVEHIELLLEQFNRRPVELLGEYAR